MKTKDLFFLFIGVITALFIVGVWTGDNRWGHTAAILVIPALGVGLALIINFLERN